MGLFWLRLIRQHRLAVSQTASPLTLWARPLARARRARELIACCPSVLYIYTKDPRRDRNRRGQRRCDGFQAVVGGKFPPAESLFSRQTVYNKLSSKQCRIRGDAEGILTLEYSVQTLNNVLLLVASSFLLFFQFSVMWFVNDAVEVWPELAVPPI